MLNKGSTTIDGITFEVSNVLNHPYLMISHHHQEIICDYATQNKAGYTTHFLYLNRLPSICITH